MDTDLLLETLQKHIVLSDADKKLILSKARERKVKKGQFLVHEGAVSRFTNFVTKGCVITYFIDLNGHSHIVQFAIEGWWISDLHSFISQEPAQFNVQALEDSDVLEFSFDGMEEVFERVPKMERYFRIITQRAFISFQQRIVQNLSMSAEDRYLEFRKKYPKIELRFPQKMIAEYLGISAEFLSKIKKRIAAKEMGSI